MATFESMDGKPFSEDDEFIKAINNLEKGASKAAKKAIYDGAGLLAGEVKEAVGDIPEYQDVERYRREKKDLENALGITPIRGNIIDGWDSKIGFDGYGSRPTKKFPQGVPNALIARSIEKGASFRSKYPFMRRTVNKNRKKVLEKMRESVNKTFEEEK